MLKSAKIAQFSEKNLNSCPFEQFNTWYLDAQGSQEISYPHAFTLSTLSSKGYPEGRVVLMKDFSKKGFTFYTNTLSNKGKSLKSYGRAGANFYWDSLGRQIRFIGRVSRVSDEEADAYYATRSRKSRIGAWASDQSEPIENREALNAKFEKYQSEFEGKELKRPPHWSGYVIEPIEFEFWIFGNNRLHDRFSYTRDADGSWKITRLQP